MGTVCRKTSQRKDEDCKLPSLLTISVPYNFLTLRSWHLPLRPLLPLSLRLMPMPTTATAMVLATTVLATTVWATGPTATTESVRLRLSLTTVSTLPTTLLPLLLPTPSMLLPQLSPATPRSPPPPPSPPLALP